MGDAAAEERQELMSIYRELPERDDVVDIVRSRGFLISEGDKKCRHTGRNLIKRLKSAPDLAVQICLALRTGMSARAVAIRFSVSPNSVVMCREAMRERGELDAVSKRVDSILDRFIELSSERIEEGILMGEIHPGQLPIPLMAAIDKRSQRDAGVVLGTGRSEGEVAVENFEAAWALAKRAVESESNAASAEVLDVQAVPSSAPVAGDSVGNMDAAGPGSCPAAGARAAAAARGQAGEGGGGGLAPSPPLDTRLDSPENFET